MNGTWVGTFESQNLGTQQITLTVVQFSNCVDGTWRNASQDLRGAISGFAAKDRRRSPLHESSQCRDGECVDEIDELVGMRHVHDLGKEQGFCFDLGALVPSEDR